LPPLCCRQVGSQQDDDAGFTCYFFHQEGLLARKHEKSAFDQARDELFSHIHRCQVLGSDRDHQEEWMKDTMQYMTERYPDLTTPEIEQLRSLGLRFCQPIIQHGSDNIAAADDEANAA